MIRTKTLERLGQGGKKLTGSVSDGLSLNILARYQLSCVAAHKVRRRRFKNAAVPTLRATEVIPALRREALFERSSIGELMKAKCVPVGAPDPGPSLGLGHDKTAQRDRAGRYNC